MLKRLCYGAVALALLSVLSGVLVFDGRTVGAASDQQTTCNPVVSTSSGVAEPTGSSAPAFTYDECSGLYISAHYQYNPATQTYSPLPGSEPTYKCDESVWRWQKTQWQYVASDSTYVQNTFYVDTVPSGYGTCSPPAPSAVTEQPGGTQSGSAADPSTQGSAGNTSGSTNPGGTSTANLANNITSGATTGSASATQNTEAGDIASGNALAAATIVNVVNSAGTAAAPVATFTRNINGDVNGNIVISLADLQPSNVDLNSTNNTSVASSSGTIVNNLNVNANSGDATASANTKVGNVTSGSAAAMVGVVNMLNSMVSAGQSFIGTINVNGNLNGDILMPAQFLSNLKASGAPSTNVVISSGDLTNLNSSSATQIINQVNSAAASGSVDSTRNTSSGDATSGSASTKVEVFNLTGQQIVGSNGLLVFVNVMGKWVGLIVGAPSGASAALLGGTMTPISPGGGAIATTSTNATITNNINVKARSGGVSSTSNTMAGDATSGSAATAVNIANFVNNSISFGGWFGILFINVLGNWNGNFGELPVASQPVFAVSGSGVHPVGSGGVSFGFVPRSSGGTKMTSTKQNLTVAKLNGAVKAANIANINNSPGVGQGGGTSSAAENPSATHWLIIAGSLFIASCLAAASRRKTI